MKKTAAERTAKSVKSKFPSKQFQTEIQAKTARTAEQNDGRSLAAAAIVVVLATIGVCAQTAHYGFTAYGVDQYVCENAILKTGITGTSLVWAATTFSDAEFNHKNAV